MYEYRAKYVANHDGDTVTLDADLGFETTRRLAVRLDRLDCPELGTEEGVLAREFTADWFTKNKNACVIRTVKDKKEKYGRYLAMIYPPGEVVFMAESSLNYALVAAGHAKPYSGGKRAS